MDFYTRWWFAPSAEAKLLSQAGIPGGDGTSVGKGTAW